MYVYTDNGLVSNAIKCIRLIRMHKFRVSFRGCGYFLDKMMKSNSPTSIFAFYMELLDCGYPLNVCNFNVLMHKLCNENKLKEAQLVFDEIRKWGLCPTIVNFNTLIIGYGKFGELEVGLG